MHVNNRASYIVWSIRPNFPYVFPPCQMTIIQTRAALWTTDEAVLHDFGQLGTIYVSDTEAHFAIANAKHPKRDNLKVSFRHGQSLKKITATSPSTYPQVQYLGKLWSCHRQSSTTANCPMHCTRSNYSALSVFHQFLQDIVKDTILCKTECSRFITVLPSQISVINQVFHSTLGLQRDVCQCIQTR